MTSVGQAEGLSFETMVLREARDTASKRLKTAVGVKVMEGLKEGGVIFALIVVILFTKKCKKASAVSGEGSEQLAWGGLRNELIVVKSTRGL